MEWCHGAKFNRMFTNLCQVHESMSNCRELCQIRWALLTSQGQRSTSMSRSQKTKKPKNAKNTKHDIKSNVQNVRFCSCLLTVTVPDITHNKLCLNNPLSPKQISEKANGSSASHLLTVPGVTLGSSVLAPSSWKGALAFRSSASRSGSPCYVMSSLCEFKEASTTFHTYNYNFTRATTSSRCSNMATV